MTIRFGETLRSLRKEKGLTQEQLAERLNVSFQTVSNWERDESWPDLSMLPVLAGFFGVTTDALLAVDRAANERRVQDILDAYDAHKPNTARKHLPVLKQAVGEYPLDFRLWVRYMEALLYCGGCGLEFSQETHKEVREIYENIDAHCTNDRIRMWAKRLFVMHLHSLAQPLEPGGPLGKPELQREAEDILNEMPDLRACREHVATMVSLPGEDHLRAVQSELASLLWMTTHAIAHHDVYGKNFPLGEATSQESQDSLYAADVDLRLLDLFYPDGDYGKNAFMVIYSRGYQAFYNAVLGNFDEAFEAMRLCIEQALAFDALPRVTTHTSPMFKGLTYDKITQDRGMAARMKELFGERYPWPAGFREDGRFGEAMGKLE
ncbi:MAG: helix-turn-helix domain-containing protein [Oscillospiraceae bacterium]|jgi:transcriptional regulator with XRE-family HTH domain|nr:helix-turn-helix domain-containing protein [Oscillospiraceae bacterium]